ALRPNVPHFAVVYYGVLRAGGVVVPMNILMKVVDEQNNEQPTGEVGEIFIRGPNVMKGYWRRPDATDETIDADGWLHTGDMAYVDEDGYFFIVDRKKDMIIRGGYNVYPREIEEGPLRAPRGARGRGRRHAAPRARRGGRRRRGAQGGPE